MDGVTVLTILVLPLNVPVSPSAGNFLSCSFLSIDPIQQTWTKHLPGTVLELWMCRGQGQGPCYWEATTITYYSLQNSWNWTNKVCINLRKGKYSALRSAQLFWVSVGVSLVRQKTKCSATTKLWMGHWPLEASVYSCVKWESYNLACSHL